MIGTASISGVADALTVTADRQIRRIVNGLRLAAGLDRPGVGCTPRTVIWSRGRASLMHYTAGADAGRPPILLVPSLINRSYIWDLRHGDSFVEHLLDAGYDVLCLDWGIPDARDAHNTMSTYVDGYMMAAVGVATRRCATPSKAAIMGLTRDLAQQWGSRKGIRVNAIAPGFFESEMTSQYQLGYLNSLAPRILLGRLGDPQELSATAVWLASDAAGYVTDQTIVVDGGVTIA